MTMMRRVLPLAMALLLISGIAGIVAGGTAAQAGWWLVVVAAVILVGLLVRRPA